MNYAWYRPDDATHRIGKNWDGLTLLSIQFPTSDPHDLISTLRQWLISISEFHGSEHLPNPMSTGKINPFSSSSIDEGIFVDNSMSSYSTINSYSLPLLALNGIIAV